MKSLPVFISISFENRQLVLDTLIWGMVQEESFVWRNPSIMFVFAVRIAERGGWISDMQTRSEISDEFIVIHHLLLLLSKRKKIRRRNLKKISCGVHNNVRENWKSLHPKVLIFYCKQAKFLYPWKSFCAKICGSVICAYFLSITDGRFKLASFTCKIFQ